MYDGDVNEGQNERVSSYMYYWTANVWKNEVRITLPASAGGRNLDLDLPAPFEPGQSHEASYDANMRPKHAWPR